jgi:hypothetical protein
VWATSVLPPVHPEDRGHRLARERRSLPAGAIVSPVNDGLSFETTNREACLTRLPDICLLLRLASNRPAEFVPPSECSIYSATGAIGAQISRGVLALLLHGRVRHRGRDRGCQLNRLARPTHPKRAQGFVIRRNASATPRRVPYPIAATLPTDRAARFIDDRSDSVSGRFSISTTRGQHHVPSSTLSASCVTRKHRAAWR